MHPQSLADLTTAGVFQLGMPTDVGGAQASEDIIAEVLAEIARGCPSTSWICTIMLAVNVIPALLCDDAAEEIYATPDLRMTGTIAPTGQAIPVEGGYRITGRWVWNTGGVHGNWFAPVCLAPTAAGTERLMVVLPTRQIHIRDTWHAAGMAGTATNTAIVDDVFVPSSRTILVNDLAEGNYPARRYSTDPYYNRPWVMFINAVSAPTLLGTARGAMDSFMAALPGRSAITYTSWSRAADAPVIHHQLAKARLALESAEMFTGRLTQLYRDASLVEPSIMHRVQARAWLGHVAALARSCVNQLFEAGGTSQVLLTSDLQRYFRDVNVLHQHAAIQPTTSNELYGRVLAGLDPNAEPL
jgi:alkylation response protein AidB-like acyl-CoA dehydrogenase